MEKGYEHVSISSLYLIQSALTPLIIPRLPLSLFVHLLASVPKKAGPLSLCMHMPRFSPPFILRAAPSSARCPAGFSNRNLPTIALERRCLGQLYFPAFRAITPVIGIEGKNKSREIGQKRDIRIGQKERKKKGKG